MLSGEARDSYLQACRSEAVRQIEHLIPDSNHPAYRAVLNYPLRAAKGLRPALAIAMCRALGGGLAEIVPTASAFELLHNAFLVHDDIEDGSEIRRHAPTLAAQLGVPLALHTGDTMLAMVMEPLLDNMRLLDLGRAIRILQLVATIIRHTVEGQALELTWIAENRWDITPDEYREMVTLKTAWYSFAGPLASGALIAEAPDSLLNEVTRFGLELGVAFQIRDDALNLLGESAEIGKESCGDLWEGKRTLVLSLFFAEAAPADVAFARDVLRKDRPSAVLEAREARLVDRALELSRNRVDLDEQKLCAIRDAFGEVRNEALKRGGEIQELRRLIDPFVSRALELAATHAKRADEAWSRIKPGLAPSVHRDLIESILDYVVARSW